MSTLAKTAIGDAKRRVRQGARKGQEKSEFLDRSVLRAQTGPSEPAATPAPQPWWVTAAVGYAKKPRVARGPTTPATTPAATPGLRAQIGSVTPAPTPAPAPAPAPAPTPRLRAEIRTRAPAATPAPAPTPAPTPASQPWYVMAAADYVPEKKTRDEAETALKLKKSNLEILESNEVYFIVRYGRKGKIVLSTINKEDEPNNLQIDYKDGNYNIQGIIGQGFQTLWDLINNYRKNGFTADKNGPYNLKLDPTQEQAAEGWRLVSDLARTDPGLVTDMTSIESEELLNSLKWTALTDEDVYFTLRYKTKEPGLVLCIINQTGDLINLNIVNKDGKYNIQGIEKSFSDLKSLITNYRTETFSWGPGKGPYKLKLDPVQQSPWEAQKRWEAQVQKRWEALDTTPKAAALGKIRTKGHAKRGSKKGSAKKGSAKRGSAKKGSAKKGSAKRRPAKKGSKKNRK